MIRTDKTLEIKGRLSEHAEMITRNTLSSLTSGQVLTVVTTDRSATVRLGSLCESLGCMLLGAKEEGGMLYVQIQR